MRAFAILLTLFVLPAGAHAASKEVIDARVAASLESFKTDIQGGSELLKRAKAVLLFPNVKKGAFFVGGAYGEGALLINGRTKGYYSTAGASFGFQFGGQANSQMLMFMTQESLDNFLETDGWEVGLNGDVTLVEFSAGEKISNLNYDAPVLAFVYGGKGLLAGVDLSGNKISPIQR